MSTTDLKNTCIVCKSKFRDIKHVYMLCEVPFERLPPEEITPLRSITINETEPDTKSFHGTTYFKADLFYRYLLLCGECEKKFDKADIYLEVKEREINN